VLFLSVLFGGVKNGTNCEVYHTLMLMLPAAGVVAGPAEDANAAVDRWSTAFNTNDPETIAKSYCPDAILLGTVSPVISEGTQAIIK
jgi:hypothetical protein